VLRAPMRAALSDPVLTNRHFRPPCRRGHQQHEPSQHFVSRYAGKLCQIAHRALATIDSKCVAKW
jgi:hypothetical protein